jgi:hypothetical protein
MPSRRCARLALAACRALSRTIMGELWLVLPKQAHVRFVVSAAHKGDTRVVKDADLERAWWFWGMRMVTPSAGRCVSC